jgi:hypothetical protein
VCHDGVWSSPLPTFASFGLVCFSSRVTRPSSLLLKCVTRRFGSRRSPSHCHPDPFAVIPSSSEGSRPARLSAFRPCPHRCHPEPREGSRSARLPAPGLCPFLPDRCCLCARTFGLSSGYRTSEAVSCHSPFVTFILNNSLFFHQHNGETTITRLFSVT